MLEYLTTSFSPQMFVLSLLSWFEYLLTARDICIVKELEDVDTMEREAVNFLCEVNQVDVDGRWYRDDCRIRPGDNIKIRHQGEIQPMCCGCGTCACSSQLQGANV